MADMNSHHEERMMLRHEKINESFHHIDDTTDEAVNLTYYVLVLFLGLPGNGIVIWVYGKRKRKTSTDVLIVAQGVIDLVACIFTPAFIVRSAFSELNTTWLCRLSGITEETCAFTTLFLTVAISVDRFMAVCRPLRRRITPRLSYVIICFCIFIAFGVNIPPTYFLSAEVHGPGPRILCLSLATSSFDLAYSIAQTFIFIVALSTSAALYTSIYIFLRRRSKTSSKLTAKAIRPATVSSTHIQPFQSTVVVEPNLDNAQTPRNSCEENKSTAWQYCKRGTSTPILVEPKLISQSFHTEEVEINQMEDTESRPIQQPKEDYNNRRGDGDRLAHNISSLESTSRSMMAKQDQPREERKNKFERSQKTTRMLLIITVYFFLTWMPHITLSVLPTNVISQITRNRSLQTAISILNSLRLTNHVINVFVYFAVNDTFRSTLRDGCIQWRR
ncbi:uncharacterized protein [Diadema antillarum]|uniref:uncharacterized protein n=1 Tax=Diadema antillarum TaxID=105358 RepID=UPI003A86E18D